jgi:eukaryotic-like serine/threonine-protein kinase
VSTVDRLTAALADRYRLERELGQGGMATVYLAEDLKHKRKVALKVLKPELAAVLGAERFVQEITTTAALQHPHILPLFDSGTADGFLYYVMPYIQGETLRSKLDRETQLGIEESVRIASDVASALHYAHQHGVIHRDIKPENILLHDGRPMVADFGIALAVSAAAGGRMTETGLSLGTPHYMSPEQATAEKEISARSDVYSLGSVLYEMLTGNPPHTGASAQQIIMKIVTEEAAPVTKLRKSVPPNVAAAVAKALEKLPADRFENARAFAEALGNAGFRGREIERKGSLVAAGNAGWKWVAAALAVALIGAGSVAMWALSRTSTEARDVGLPPNAPLQMAGPFRTYTVSRDGAFVVYLARVGDETQLWYRSLTGPDARQIPGTEGAAGTPRLSPDGTQVAFQVAGEMKLVPIAGGTVSTVGRAQDPQGGEWLADGRLFVGENDGRLLRWIDLGAGSVRDLGTIYCLHPQWIGSDRVLCGGGADNFAAVIALDRPGEKTAIRQSIGTPESGSSVLIGSHFRLIDQHYLVYMAGDGTLMGTRITDVDSLRVGRSVPLVPMVRRSVYSGVGQYDLTDDGTLTYIPGINADIGRLVRLTRDGRFVPLPVEQGAYLRFALSPDGRKLATVAQGLQRQELTVFDLENGTRESHDTAFFIGAPSWGPDGGSLAYRRSGDPGEESVLLRRLDSPGDPIPLLTHQPALRVQVSSYLAADFLLVGSSSPGGGAVIVDPTRTPAMVDSVGLPAFFVSISPDRRWVAYQNLGVTGVHLQPWPALDRRYLIDADGTEPRWASSSELVYLSQYRSAGVIAASLYRIRIGANASSPVGSRELIVQDPRFADTPGWSVATTAEGEVIYLQSPTENSGFYVRVIPGWVDRMKRAVDAANR